MLSGIDKKYCGNKNIIVLNKRKLENLISNNSICEEIRLHFVFKFFEQRTVNSERE